MIDSIVELLIQLSLWLASANTQEERQTFAIEAAPLEMSFVWLG